MIHPHALGIKARSDRDEGIASIAEGQRLLDELTLIASRAAAAILAVRGPGPRPARQGRPLAGDGRRRGVGGRDPRGPGAASARRAGRVGGSRGQQRAGRARRTLPAGRSARRHPRAAGRREPNTPSTSRWCASGVPVLGVIAAPALGLVWRGIVGHGAERLRLAPGAPPSAASERTAIRTRPRPARGLVARPQPLPSRRPKPTSISIACRTCSGRSSARR